MTTTENQEIVSAQVILRPADGREIPANAAITAESLVLYLPSEEAAGLVREFFRKAGFTVGNLVGISFSISGTAATFESLFKVDLQHEDRGGIRAAKADSSTGYQLPLDPLPQNIRPAVSAVTFTPPPDFGPTQFM